MSTPRMTRAHFELIARVLADSKNAPHGDLVKAFSDELGATNHAFDRGRFESAAGL